MTKQEMAEEILVDLVLEDVMNETSLVEGNAAHDAKGRFTSKGAGAAYASGIMAAGRAAGIVAKKAGESRDDVRQAIVRGMSDHKVDVKAAAKEIGAKEAKSWGKWQGGKDLQHARKARQKDSFSVKVHGGGEEKFKTWREAKTAADAHRKSGKVAVVTQHVHGSPWD